MQTSIKRILRQYPGQTVSIVSHGYLLRVFNCYIHGLPIQEINSPGLSGNPCVFCVDIAPDGQMQVQRTNEMNHLPEEIGPGRYPDTERGTDHEDYGG